MSSLPVQLAAERFDAAVDEAIRNLRFSSEATVADIARTCAWFSTPEREVFARVEFVNGKPSVYFVRGTHADFHPAFLRRQAE